MTEDNRQRHNQMQVEYFDQRAELFQQPIPGEIQERTAGIVMTAGVNPRSVILDVGTGTGVLIGHFLAAGAKQSNIVGCDLTETMLKIACTRYNEVCFWRGDIMDFTLEQIAPAGKGAGVGSSAALGQNAILQPMSSQRTEPIKGFDFIFFNACFANMLDRQAVVAHCRNLLLPGGKIVISHPAPEYVAWVKESDPNIIPHNHPSKDEALSWSQQFGFSLEHFESGETLYLAILKRAV